MSTYVTRLVEVKIEDINGEVYKEEQLNDIKDPQEGMVYRAFNDYEYRYRVYHAEPDENNNHWHKLKECKYKWVFLKYYANKRYGYSYNDEKSFKIENTNEDVKEIDNFCDNGGSIRDVYLSRWNNTYNIIDRGVPDDISEECKKELHLDDKSYAYGYTYLLLSEWNSIYAKELEKFKSNIKETIFKSELKTINEKLDKIYNKSCGVEVPEPVKKESDEDSEKFTDEYDEDNYYNSLDYLFEDDFNDLTCVNDEIVKVYHIVDSIFGYIPEDRIRIIYYFS